MTTLTKEQFNNIIEEHGSDLASKEAEMSKRDLSDGRLSREEYLSGGKEINEYINQIFSEEGIELSEENISKFKDFREELYNDLNKKRESYSNEVTKPIDNPFPEHAPLSPRDGYNSPDGDPLVKDIQQRLVAEGYDVGKHGDDGKFGPDTMEAVKKFQKENGLSPDGIFDAKDFEKLNELKVEREAKESGVSQENKAKLNNQTILKETIGKFDKIPDNLSINLYSDKENKINKTELKGTKLNDEFVIKDEQTINKYKIDLGEGEDKLTLGNHLKIKDGGLKVDSNDYKQDVINIGRNLKGTVTLFNDDKDKLVLAGKEGNYKVEKEGGFLGFGGEVKSITTPSGGIINLSGIESGNITFSGDVNESSPPSQAQDNARDIANSSLSK